MGAVYMARQINLNRLVAIKVLAHDPANDTFNPPGPQPSGDVSVIQVTPDGSDLGAIVEADGWPLFVESN